MAKIRETRCLVCGYSGGVFQRVTYSGAPEGGVPVHVECVAEFFHKIDASPFWRLTPKHVD